VRRIVDDEGPLDLDECIRKTLRIEPSERFLPTIRRRLSVEPSIDDWSHRWFAILGLATAVAVVIVLVGDRRHDSDAIYATIDARPTGADITLMPKGPEASLAPAPAIRRGPPRQERSTLVRQPRAADFDLVVASLNDARIRIVVDESSPQTADDASLAIPPIQIEPLVTP
jgi:hypothetical protein